MRFPDEPQRRRKSSDFVAAEEAGALFQEAAPLVAVADQAEAEAGILARHRLESHFVDDQQRRRQVLLRPQPRRRQPGVAPQRGQQVLQPVEDRTEGVFDRGYPQREGRPSTRS